MIQSLGALPLLQEPTPPTPPPPPTVQDIEISFNAQDTVAMPSSSTTIKNVENGMRVEKVELRDHNLEPVDGKLVFPDHDPRNTHAVSFAAAANTVAAFEEATGLAVPWAFGGDRLGVYADDGVMLNAYYSRGEGSIHFFHDTDVVTGALVRSGASGEVVAHEVGHAILDGLRPGYLETWSTDPGAFHESFGDQIGMLMALMDERTINRVAVQTGGNLRKQNVVAHLGEELGRGINDKVGRNRTGGDWVRNAINAFVWADPATLPDRGDDTHLGSEVHDFSRLWSGAFYDVLCGINQSFLDSGMSVKDALRATGREGTKILGNLLREAPQGDHTYKDMAEAFVAADRTHNNGQWAGLIEKVYTDRLILQPPPPPPEDPTEPTPPPTGFEAGSSRRGIATSTPEGRKSLDDVTRTVRVKLSGQEYGMFNGAVVETVVDKDGSLAKDAEAASRTRKALANHIKAGRVRYNDPSYQMKKDDYFDKNGNPYIGAVRWENGQMVIERVKITA
ncbi:MAG: hypothetical protein FJX76_23280 [Armatimonadetes bacterium]|nr:hypothetical protein [Armatimonadota bacterium]